jgi:hypothetical protein
LKNFNDNASASEADCELLLSTDSTVHAPGYRETVHGCNTENWLQAIRTDDESDYKNEPPPPPQKKKNTPEEQE